MKILIEEVNKLSVPYDEVWNENVKEKFCRKLEDVRRTDHKFFSQYWQGYAWSAIIGFLNNRRESLTTKDSSFKYQVISNQSSRIANALILMAISKSEIGIEILNQPEDIVKIISEYCKGGAKFIKEIRETPGSENKFDSEDDFFDELMERR